MSKVNCFIARKLLNRWFFFWPLTGIKYCGSIEVTYRKYEREKERARATERESESEKETWKFVEQIFVKSHNKRREFSRQTVKLWIGNMWRKKRSTKVWQKMERKPLHMHLSNTKTTTAAAMTMRKGKKDFGSPLYFSHSLWV